MFFHVCTWMVKVVEVLYTEYSLMRSFTMLQPCCHTSKSCGFLRCIRKLENVSLLMSVVSFKTYLGYNFCRLNIWMRYLKPNSLHCQNRGVRWVNVENVCTIWSISLPNRHVSIVAHVRMCIISLKRVLSRFFYYSFCCSLCQLYFGFISDEKMVSLQIVSCLSIVY